MVWMYQDGTHLKEFSSQRRKIQEEKQEFSWPCRWSDDPNEGRTIKMKNLVKNMSWYQLSHGSDSWIIDNGSSRHMVGYKCSL